MLAPGRYSADNVPVKGVCTGQANGTREIRAAPAHAPANNGSASARRLAVGHTCVVRVAGLNVTAGGGRSSGAADTARLSAWAGQHVDVEGAAHEIGPRPVTRRRR